MRPCSPLNGSGAHEPLTDIHALGKACATEVALGNITDCQALANFAASVYDYADESLFRSAFSIFGPKQHGGYSDEMVVFAGNQSGFRQRYRDSQRPNEFQTHHFVLFFGIGARIHTTDIETADCCRCLSSWARDYPWSTS